MEIDLVALRDILTGTLTLPDLRAAGGEEQVWPALPQVCALNAVRPGCLRLAVFSLFAETERQLWPLTVKPYGHV